MPASSGHDALIDRLDTLLAEHLTLLDSYTSLRNILDGQLHCGYYSLASANRNADTWLGTGRRFGQEGFDQRMKAGSVLHIAARKNNAQNTKGKSTTESEEPKTEEDARESKNGAAGADAQDQLPNLALDAYKTLPELHLGAFTCVQSATGCPPGLLDTTETKTETVTDTNTNTPPSDNPSNSSSKTKPKTKPATRDPLHWYTPLPPDVLRRTQKIFGASLPTISSLVNVTQELDALDAEVRAVRREIALLAGKAEDEGDGRATGVVAEEVEAETEEDQDGAEAGQQGALRAAVSPSETKAGSKQSPQAATSRALRLGKVGGGKEPRSRVLKMQ